MRKGLIIAGVALAWGVAAPAADFVNLGFNEYTLGDGGFADVPGWGKFFADPFSLGGAYIGLVATNNDDLVPLEGKAALFLGTGSFFNPPYEIWVSQTAVVPAYAAQIRFWTTLPGVSVTLSNIFLTASAPDEPWPGCYQYTTDIRALAGQTATLKITIYGSAWGRYQLDKIEFLGEEGVVIWPFPGPGAGVCLDDFHAATLNTSLWEVVSAVTQVFYQISSERIRADVGFVNGMVVNPFETYFRFRSPLRSDWDVRMDFQFDPDLHSTNPGVIGMALAADFGSAGTAQARVGQVVDLNSANRRYIVDWGPGPTNEVATTNSTGVFRLVRTGWEVAGYVWDAGSNRWRVVGTADGYTDEVAHVGLKVWCTGTFTGGSKTGDGYSLFYADNLMLADGRACLDGLATKVFGLDESGAPTFTWDTVGIPESNRYFVTRATSLVDSAWLPVSEEITDSGGETNWTGTDSGAGPFYYRLEVAPP